MNRDDINKLKYNAAKGSGLWIGLFLEEDHGIARYLPLDPHITVLHLGRRAEPALVEKAVLAARDARWCNGTKSLQWPIAYTITGCGVFWRRSGSHTPVFLVDSHTLTNTLRPFLTRSLPCDTSYGFIPHITAANGIDMQGMNHMPQPVGKGYFKDLWVCCGQDAQYKITMEPKQGELL